MRHFAHRHVLPASLIGLLLAAVACTSAKKGGGDETHASETDGGDATAPAPGTQPQSFTQGQQPVAVTGANLVDYASARVRCDYQDAPTANTYNAHCLVVSHGSDGHELAATGLAPGVTLNWSAPQTARGVLSFGNCAATNSQLGYECAVAVNDTTQLAEAAFGFQVQDKTNAPRQESATVLLPYAVSVAAGFIPNMPYQYDSQSAAMVAANAAPSATPVGYQHFSFAANIASFPFPNGICQRDSRLFFADQFSIYQVQNGQVTHYAGSGNAQNIANTTDKLRAFLLPAYIACTADAVYVTSTELSRIYKLTDAGTVQIVGGTGSATDAADGVLAANSGIQDPRGIVVDSKGNIIFADTAAHKVRIITAAGLLQTVAGTGSAGYTGDNGQARLATLTSPIGVALGSDGSLYIADVDTATVRKVSPTGIITTIAGTGTQRYAATLLTTRALAEPQQVGLDASGNLYVSELFRGIKRIMPDGSLVQVVSAGADITQSARQMRTDVHNAAGVGNILPTASIIMQRPEFGIMAIDPSTGIFYVEGPQGVLSFPAPTAAASTVAAGSTTAGSIAVGSSNTQAADCAGAVDASKTRLVEAAGIAIAPDNSLVIADWLSLTANQLVVHRVTRARRVRKRKLYTAAKPQRRSPPSTRTPTVRRSIRSAASSPAPMARSIWRRSRKTASSNSLRTAR